MTGIGTISTVASVPQVQAAVVPSVKTAPTATVTPAGSSLPSSPASQLVVDAPSGTVITEFLNSSGALQAQIPSTVAIAYLRAGLTADGLNRASVVAGGAA